MRGIPCCVWRRQEEEKEEERAVQRNGTVLLCDVFVISMKLFDGCSFSESFNNLLSSLLIAKLANATVT